MDTNSTTTTTTTTKTSTNTSSISSVGGGFSRGTKVFMSNGSIERIENIQVGQYVLGHDSTPKEVVALSRGTSEVLYRIKQNTKHYTEDAFGIVSFTCSSNQSLLTTCPISVVKGHRSKSNKYEIVYVGLRDVPFTDGSQGTIPSQFTRSFHKEVEADAFSETIPRAPINSTIKVCDVDLLGVKVRSYLVQHLAPVLIENNVFRSQYCQPWMNVDKVAYLGGAWVGDGTMIKCTYTIGIDDIEFIDRIQNYAESFNLDVDRNLEPEKNLYRVILRPRFILGQGVNQPINTNNDLWVVFTQVFRNEIGNLCKFIPLFMASEPIDVRDNFLAGAIDSDGYVSSDGAAIIKTIYKRVYKGLVAIARSLGIVVGVGFEAENTDRLGVHRRDKWIVQLRPSHELNRVLSKCSLARKSAVAPTTVARKHIPIHFSKTVVEGGDWFGITLRDGKSFILANYMVVSHNEDVVQSDSDSDSDSEPSMMLSKRKRTTEASPPAKKPNDDLFDSEESD